MSTLKSLSCILKKPKHSLFPGMPVPIAVIVCEGDHSAYIQDSFEQTYHNERVGQSGRSCTGFP